MTNFFHEKPQVTTLADEDFIINIDVSTGNTVKIIKKVDLVSVVLNGNTIASGADAIALLAATQTLTNKTLDSVAITTGMTVDFASLVANLNADQVDSKDVGVGVDDIPVLVSGASVDGIDVALVDLLVSSLLRTDKIDKTTKVTANIYGLAYIEFGVVELDGTSNVVNLGLPAIAQANAGAKVLLWCSNATNDCIIARDGSDEMSLLKDDGTNLVMITISFKAVGDFVVLEATPSKYWMVTGGKFTSFT